MPSLNAYDIAVWFSCVEGADGSTSGLDLYLAGTNTSTTLNSTQYLSITDIMVTNPIDNACQVYLTTLAPNTSHTLVTPANLLLQFSCGSALGNQTFHASTPYSLCGVLGVVPSVIDSTYGRAPNWTVNGVGVITTSVGIALAPQPL
jgi:hypothetical protein